MKEKIANFVNSVRLRYTAQSRFFQIVTAGVALVLVGGVVVFAATSGNKVVNAEADKTKTAVDQSAVSVAIVGVDDSASISGTLSNSWPGEIISSEVSHLQPQREGVITNWFVRIGDVVSAGDVLGKISAPPATPELTAMLAEKTEALTMARTGAAIADEYATKEQTRLAELEKSIVQPVAGTSSFVPTTISRMREVAETMRAGVRSSIEKILDAHILKTTTKTSWRQIDSSPDIPNLLYGALDSQTRNDYQLALTTLAGELKKSSDAPIEAARKYLAAAERLVDRSIIGSDSSVDEFRTMVGEDRKEFSEIFASYQESLADVADKETEYALMIGEKKAMIEKDRLMAHATVKANEASYNTVANQIKGGVYVIAPRGGTVSAIYKNVGDLVDPTMKIATVAGSDRKNLIVRMRIPNNIRKPSVGELVSVVRPGFSADKKMATILGVGAVLDENGSYMADATLTEKADWSAGVSVRVIPPQSLETPMIKFSAVWWSKTGLPHIWGVSEAGRIFARKITIGRTIGDSVEVYDGIKNGDSYIVTPTPLVAEDMLINDVLRENIEADSQDVPKEEKPMGGMEM